MKGLSKKEIEIIAELEFKKKYYFNIEEIKSHFKNKKQIVNTIYNLKKKGRIIRLNRNKYFLVPIKAKSGKWTDNPEIIADEICNGKEYYIGGWFAANYWGLTEQIPMQLDIWTTKRQGKIKLLNIRMMFHRTTNKDIKKKGTTEKISNHEFKVMNKEYSKRWIKLRQ